MKRKYTHKSAFHLFHFSKTIQNKYFYAEFNRGNMNLQNIKKLLSTLILVLVTASAALAGNVSGIVVDDTDSSAMINATLRILTRRDSAYVAGGMSDNDGRFSFSGLKAGKYLVEASYLGYQTLRKGFVRRTDADKVRLDTLRLYSSSIRLKETEVVGVKTEVRVAQDTVEYNAGSYKTQPTAVVEDLLKRLPGVEVSSDGKITAQGKEVTKILVDGKEFFSDDSKVASKNIPASIVDKLQVIDRKSDLARLTGVDDGEDETVINLTVKKGMKQGWFGNANAGYGTDDRYSGNFMVNRFVNDNQISILGNANNINEIGFSGPGDRFRRFGGMNGINNAQSLGLNFNVGNDDKFRAGGDLMYSHTNQHTTKKTNKQYLFADSTSYENSASNSYDRNHNIRGDFRLKWEADSFNTLEFRPSFNLSFNDSESSDSARVNAGDAVQTLVNRSRNDVTSNGTSYEFGGELVYNHRLRSNPARSFSVQGTYRYSNTQEDETTYAVNQFFQVAGEDETRDQQTDNHKWTSRVGTRLTWTEPLGDVRKGRALTFAYRMNYYFNNADKLVYDINSTYNVSRAMKMTEQTYGVLTNPVAALAIAESTGSLTPTLNEEQSNRFRNDQFDQSLRIGFQQNSRTLRFNAGLSVNPTMMRSEDLINTARNIPERWVWNFAPFMRLRYSFTKTHSLALDYRGSTQSPTMAQLQPVADLSDPLRVVVGNPNLVPAFQHRLNARYNNFNQESQRSIMAFAGFSTTRNSIVSKTTYDNETGRQTTTYDNVNGVWSADGMMMFTSPLRNKNWQFANNVFFRYNHAVGYNNGELNKSGSLFLAETPSIAYRTDLIDVELRPYYNIQMTRNSLQASNNRNVHSYGATFNANYTTPFSVVLSTDLTYGNASGYSAGYDSKQWLWNASIAYEFLRNKAATLTLRAYDLLHQRKSISRNVSANYIEDVDMNTVTRYFMLSFAYRFQIFGKGTSEKDIKQPDYDGFGPRPPMDNNNRRRSGFRPMGPPPGGGPR